VDVVINQLHTKRQPKYIKFKVKLFPAVLLVFSFLLSALLPAAPLFADDPPAFSLTKSSARPGESVYVNQVDACPAVPTGFDGQSVEFTFIDANNVQTVLRDQAVVDTNGDWLYDTAFSVPWREIRADFNPVQITNAAAAGTATIEARCVAFDQGEDDMDNSDNIYQVTQTYAPESLTVMSPLEFNLSASTIVTGRMLHITSTSNCPGGGDQEIHGGVVNGQAVSNFYVSNTNPDGSWSVDVPMQYEDMADTYDFPAGDYAVNAVCMDPIAGGDAWHYGEKLVHVKGPNYVAMGDSYSSGEGIEPFELGTEDGCHRSPAAYARSLENSSNPLLNMGEDGFVACAGAVAADITNSQMSKVTADTDLITMTIGGNDMDFRGFATSCTGYITNDCTGTPANNAIARISTDVIPHVRSMLEGLEDRLIELGNTDAKVLVVGYPQLLPTVSANCDWLNSQNETNAIRDVTTHLNTAVRNEVTEIDYGFDFVSATESNSPFIDHELCRPSSSTGAAYFFGPMLAPSVNYSFHPNADGQQAYKQLISDYLSSHPL
jgi:hypothetical protein